MRIAVIHPDGAVSAYRLGRVEDGVSNVDTLGNKTMPIDDMLDQLEAQAKEEFPDCKVERQKLVMVEGHDDPENPIDESEWVPIGKVKKTHVPTRPGESAVPEVFLNATTTERAG